MSIYHYVDVYMKMCFLLHFLFFSSPGPSALFTSVINVLNETFLYQIPLNGYFGKSEDPDEMLQNL